MKFSGKTLLTLVVSLSGLAAAAASEAETFLASNPDVQVGRDALDAAEAASGPDTFSIVNKPVSNVVLYQEYNADTHERIYAVALVDDEKAEAYYKENNEDGDVEDKGKLMKRFEVPAEVDANKCRRGLESIEPHILFERAARCGQFCARRRSCTRDRRCRRCTYVGGPNCQHQLSCKR